MGEEYIEVIIDKDGQMKIETHGIESDCMETIEKLLENIMALEEIEHSKKARKPANYQKSSSNQDVDLEGEN